MQKKSSSTPHDALFKQFMMHRETARDFLAIHLPPELLNFCRLDTLQLESGSFIEEHLRAYYADVLYSLRMTDGDGYIYALIEHQSTPDRHMSFRLMRYAIAAMQRHLDAGHHDLPLVIPILFYQGKTSPYPWSMRWLDAFTRPALAEALYTGVFPLVDITVMSDDDIMQHRRVALLELVQKHIRARDVTLLVDKLVTLLLLGYTTSGQLRALMHYLLHAGNTTAPVAFIRHLAHRSPQHKDTLMTIAQKLEELGRRKGVRQGRKEGEKDGRQAEARRIAHAMLQSGLDLSLVKKITGLTEGDLSLPSS
ncbi:Rpn family recombination-promoting nuclease/putative transposase [Enterobacter sp. ENT03]|uniref:Rpn family recombination-promoting nuclease/putative transposase n=1 Tax=Enterobacter sp. ENT03 TaxID=2854780 RepID=UPI001C4953D4|nr:Rpn family recombination-promoting nuclease/putative transposase [Enterobacter sp. ENT03]MBV7406212.1 Rpn family recombination-promoting nuclease/putative transposase [Enterobacter sp. ENT03]